MVRFSSLFALLFLFGQCSSVQKYEAIADQWETDMLNFDSLNSTQNYPDESILFVGSSSIRLWNNIAEDMAPYQVIQRGYGGASYADLAFHIERIVYPLAFEALVVFAGNDIWGKETDRSPVEIRRLLEHIVKRVKNEFGNLPVFVIEVTHVPVREHLTAEIDDQNQALKEVCDKYDHVHWIPTRQLYLTSEGQVKRDLFKDDNIHQNDEGYNLWTEQIKKTIKPVLEVNRNIE